MPNHPETLMDIDRVSIRHRPEGKHVMQQTWDKLLFMHWAVAEADIRPLVPSGLEIDKYEGTAWIGVTPFTMPEIRPPGLPAPPLLGHSHEINVRTYVHRDGIPGVWFLSLDASNPMAVIGARLGFSLPYFIARMSLEEQDRTIRFQSRRTHLGAPKAEFEAEWRREDALPDVQPGSRDFFLIERYCLYAARGNRLYRARIHHEPWPLCRVSRLTYTSSMLEAQGLSASSNPPLLHGQIAPLDVQIWAPERL